MTDMPLYFFCSKGSRGVARILPRGVLKIEMQYLMHTFKTTMGWVLGAGVETSIGQAM